MMQGQSQWRVAGLFRVAIIAMLVGCNFVHGLDETKLAPPDPDGDLVLDGDNCPEIANPNQEDGDVDGFGDVCDFCAIKPTALNTDEDGDLVGDDCDLCPALPDFQVDTDMDGVGNDCAIGTPTRAVLFDGFRVLEDTWVSPVEWARANSAIEPVDVDSDVGLQNHSVAVEGSVWLMTVEVRAKRPWKTGDRFGLGIVAPDGTPLVRGRMSCDQKCELFLEKDGQLLQRGDVVKSNPIVRITLIRIPGSISSRSGLRLDLEGLISMFVEVDSPAIAGAPVLYSSPEIRLSHVVVYALD